MSTASRSGVTKGLPFPETTTKTLLSLYSRGITGWGLKYEPFLTVAQDATNLSLEQIKVV